MIYLLDEGGFGVGASIVGNRGCRDNAFNSYILVKQMMLMPCLLPGILTSATIFKFKADKVEPWSTREQTRPAKIKSYYVVTSHTFTSLLVDFKIYLSLFIDWSRTSATVTAIQVNPAQHFRKQAHQTMKTRGKERSIYDSYQQNRLYIGKGRETKCTRTKGDNIVAEATVASEIVLLSM